MFSTPSLAGTRTIFCKVTIRDNLDTSLTKAEGADKTNFSSLRMALSAAEQAFLDVQLTPLLSFTAAALPGWAVTAITANDITLTKNAVVGSGNAAAQLRCRIRRPHSLGL